MSKRMLAALLALAGAFLALYLTLYKLGAIGTLACTIGGCEQVQTSRWASFLGLPVAAWGLAFYLTVLAIALVGVQDRWAESRAISVALTALSGWGLVFTCWLTWLELYVIHAICQYCVGSAVIVLALFVVSVLDWRERGREEAAEGGGSRVESEGSRVGGRG